jgi:predicted SnoaL-like aldol condensation-catalyzing enzyme
MSIDPETALAFVESYGRTWENWDVEAFVELFSDDVRYVAHPQEAVSGRAALKRYFAKEQAEQGTVSVRMGRPMVDGDHVIAEFWVAAIDQGEEATIVGCLIAQLQESNGQCTRFREYWFDIDEQVRPFDGWGE